MSKVLKGAQGTVATAATVRGHLKNSSAVNHAYMYPSGTTTSKNLPSTQTARGGVSPVQSARGMGK